MDRAEPPDEMSSHTPYTVLAALNEPWPATLIHPSALVIAEIRALATAGLGDGADAVKTLRASVTVRYRNDRFVRPLYELLARPEPVAGLNGLLEAWREIIAADPSAAGPWGGPDPS